MFGVLAGCFGQQVVTEQFVRRVLLEDGLDQLQVLVSAILPLLENAPSGSIQADLVVVSR